MSKRIIRSKYYFGHNIYEVIVWMNKHKSIRQRKRMIKNLMFEDTDMDKYTYQEITRILGIELTIKDISNNEEYLHKLIYWGLVI